jgi:hypothetical protein
LNTSPPKFSNTRIVKEKENITASVSTITLKKETILLSEDKKDRLSFNILIIQLKLKIIQEFILLDLVDVLWKTGDDAVTRQIRCSRPSIGSSLHDSLHPSISGMHMIDSSHF